MINLRLNFGFLHQNTNNQMKAVHFDPINSCTKFILLISTFYHIENLSLTVSNIMFDSILRQLHGHLGQKQYL